MEKLNRITVVDVELNGARIYGNKNSLIFEDEENKNVFELTWPEIWKACEEYFQ